MNDKFDELAKNMALSVTHRGAGEETRPRPREHRAGISEAGKQGKHHSKARRSGRSLRLQQAMLNGADLLPDIPASPERYILRGLHLSVCARILILTAFATAWFLCNAAA